MTAAAIQETLQGLVTWLAANQVIKYETLCLMQVLLRLAEDFADPQAHIFRLIS
jgi:hypothetical protein